MSVDLRTNDFLRRLRCEIKWTNLTKGSMRLWVDSKRPGCDSIATVYNSLYFFSLKSEAKSELLDSLMNLTLWINCLTDLNFVRCRFISGVCCKHFRLVNECKNIRSESVKSLALFAQSKCVLVKVVCVGLHQFRAQTQYRVIEA